MLKEQNQLLLPALRAHMGDWVYYIAMMKLTDIAERVQFAEDIHKSEKLNEFIQRNLLTSRADDIAEYLVNQPQRLFNSIIVGVYGGEPQWLEIAVQENRTFAELPISQQGLLGFLKLSGKEELFALDGQHRLAGIKKATEQDELFSRIGDEEVSVIFVGHQKTPQGLERTRRLFTTLNRYAKPVSPSEIIALDEDNLAAILTRYLVENHKLFRENRISLSKQNSIPKSDSNSFTTIVTVYKIADLLLPVYLKETKLISPSRKWGNFKKIRPRQEIISKAKEYMFHFWDKVIQHFPALDEYLEYRDDKGNKAEKFRNQNGGHILFRPVGLLSYAKAIKRTLGANWSLEETLKKISRIETDIACEPWRGVLWESTAKRMITSKEHQTLTEKLILYMIGFELSKIKIDIEALKKEYASVLNKTVEKISLPKQV